MSTPSQSVDLSSLRISREKPPGRSPGAPSKLRTMIVIAAAVLVIGVGGAYLFFAMTAPAIPVEVGTVALVSSAQASALLNASGYVVADRKAAVASKGTGRLQVLNVGEGDYIRKDGIIGRLESSDVDAAVGQARAALEVAKAAVEQAKAEDDDATANYERSKALFAKSLVAKSDLDAATNRYRRGRALVASAVAGVAVADATVRAAEVQVENTYIRAPFDGTILTKNANLGEVITPFGAAAGSRGAVVTMADMSSLEVEADVSESNIERVRVDQPVEITLDAIPDRRYPGRVKKIVQTADRAKATVLTKISFLSIDHRVLPEMSAKVAYLPDTTAAMDTSAPKLTVPTSAVAARGDAKVVFRVRDQSVDEVRVGLGRPIGDHIEVLSGLAAGDRVVLHPAPELRAGSKIALPK